MRSEIFGIKCFAAVVMASWAWSSPMNAQGLIDDFGNLFERCRLSVETNSAFESEGLQRRHVAERHARDRGMSSTQEAWMLPASELYVVLTKWVSQDGTTRHLCDISLADEEYTLSAVEQALLLRHFLVTQVQLIGFGTHEFDKRLSPIPPVVNAAFLLSDRNPNGCVVSNSFAFSPDGRFFAAGSGEQAVKPCEAE
ncbi:conserved exported hypothetical protein [Roseovarius sp. EC-HK134]|uniref:hypothetical protein n=1 Tax=Roseovarius TaxID=74030 RepID=UPI001258FC87|nr:MULTISPECIES: hypothetical protein [Roseovarius]MBW4973412.1 hypothetical protein [Roseovarius mucosus]VVT02672.1 conserved exported hypothetical protein [Roseovarius sp. EC-HK134]VVT03346.1 conserved exported hypothetical protein [Roseovarius sp. EC-SD190]